VSTIAAPDAGTPSQLLLVLARIEMLTYAQATDRSVLLASQHLFMALTSASFSLCSFGTKGSSS
jgi:hypothetical protein